jgi:hypothetical protein
MIEPNVLRVGLSLQPFPFHFSAFARLLLITLLRV